MISGCMQPSAFNDLISFYKSREVVGTPCLLGSKYKSFKFIEVLPQLCIWSATTNLHAIQRGHSTTWWTEFCHFLTHPPNCRDSFYTLSVDKNRHFLTPSPPHLLHVVIECPQGPKEHFDCIAIIYAQPVVTFILDFGIVHK